MRNRFHGRRDRGAAAVEFALVVPLLLILLLGTVEFGRAYNAQISVTAAAREGARVMAVQDDNGAAQAATVAAAVGVSPVNVSVTPSTCSPGTNVTVTATHPFTFVAGAFGPGVTLTGRGVMRCGG